MVGIFGCQIDLNGRNYDLYVNILTVFLYAYVLNKSFDSIQAIPFLIDRQTKAWGINVWNCYRKVRRNVKIFDCYNYLNTEKMVLTEHEKRIQIQEQE